MNNAQLAARVADQGGLSKEGARKLIETVFAAITETAAAGDEVSINGSGKFKVKNSAARDGRNPATGEPMAIKASKKLGFTPAKAVKDKLNA